VARSLTARTWNRVDLVLAATGHAAAPPRAAMNSRRPARQVVEGEKLRGEMPDRSALLTPRPRPRALRAGRNCGLYSGVVMALVPPRMEDTMCWEVDYKFVAEQKKAQENRVKQEQRAGVIDQLLNNANKQDEDTKVEVAQVTEVTPAE
jgi:hypothetical protein